MTQKYTCLVDAESVLDIGIGGQQWTVQNGPQNCPLQNLEKLSTNQKLGYLGVNKRLKNSKTFAL